MRLLKLCKTLSWAMGCKTNGRLKTFMTYILPTLIAVSVFGVYFFLKQDGGVILTGWTNRYRNSKLESGVVRDNQQPGEPDTVGVLKEEEGEGEEVLLPHQHVFYLKTHKTASSTIHNILAEYCRSHDLVPLVPRVKHFNQGGKFIERQANLIDNVQNYDMVFGHHIYSSKMFQFMYDDAFRLTSLRDPYDNFVSAFWYFKRKRKEYLVDVPTDDPITEFLRHPEKYEIKGYKSWTNNRQSVDLGYDAAKGFNNMEYIKKFINLTDSRFDLVLITEYFDEGLIILKRTLRWKTEDILYNKKNVGTHYGNDAATNKTTLETERRNLHAKFSQADLLLYVHFLNRFKKIMDQTNGLKEEVAEFRNILIHVRNYCNAARPPNSNLVIPAGKWTNRFQINQVKCKMLKKGYFAMTRFLQNRQEAIFSQNGTVIKL